MTIPESNSSVFLNSIAFRTTGNSSSADVSYHVWHRYEVCVASSADRYKAYNPNGPADEGPGPVGYVALVLAWAVPGLGHLLIGQKVRGVIFMLAIHGLFAAGLLLAGIRAINPPEQAIWTYTQYLAGWPMVVADKLEKNSRAELGDRAADPRSNDYKGRLGLLFLRETPARETLDDKQVRARQFIRDHPSFAVDPRMQDLGAVYCGIAGMLNLLVMFDVLLRITGAARDDAKKKRPVPVPPPAPAAPAAEAGK
jgi:hypothetical protein